MEIAMDFEDIYEIVMRMENTRMLLIKGDIERAKRVLDKLENDLRGVIYPKR